MTRVSSRASATSVLEDLRRRLDATRWPDEPPHAGPSTGSGLAAARELAAYWRDGYDWRAAEAVLNGFEQAVVEGVHFLADGDGPAAACCCTAGRRACGSSRGSSRCCASTRG